jgi:hypothetical protein
MTTGVLPPNALCGIYIVDVREKCSCLFLTVQKQQTVKKIRQKDDDTVNKNNNAKITLS